MSYDGFDGKSFKKRHVDSVSKTVDQTIKSVADYKSFLDGLSVKKKP